MTESTIEMVAPGGFASPQSEIVSAFRLSSLRSSSLKELRSNPQEEQAIVGLPTIEMVAPGGFEPPSPAPKAGMLDHYTTGLYGKTSVVIKGNIKLVQYIFPFHSGKEES